MRVVHTVCMQVNRDPIRYSLRYTATQGMCANNSMIILLKICNDSDRCNWIVAWQTCITCRARTHASILLPVCRRRMCASELANKFPRRCRHCWRSPPTRMNAHILHNPLRMFTPNWMHSEHATLHVLTCSRSVSCAVMFMDKSAPGNLNHTRVGQNRMSVMHVTLVDLVVYW